MPRRMMLSPEHEVNGVGAGDWLCPIPPPPLAVAGSTSPQLTLPPVLRTQRKSVGYHRSLSVPILSEGGGAQRPRVARTMASTHEVAALLEQVKEANFGDFGVVASPIVSDSSSFQLTGSLSAQVRKTPILSKRTTSQKSPLLVDSLHVIRNPSRTRVGRQESSVEGPSPIVSLPKSLLCVEDEPAAEGGSQGSSGEGSGKSCAATTTTTHTETLDSDSVGASSEVTDQYSEFGGEDASESADEGEQVAETGEECEVVGLLPRQKEESTEFEGERKTAPKLRRRKKAVSSCPTLHKKKKKRARFATNTDGSVKTIEHNRRDYFGNNEYHAWAIWFSPQEMSEMHDQAFCVMDFFAKYRFDYTLEVSSLVSNCAQSDANIYDILKNSAGNLSSTAVSRGLETAMVPSLQLRRQRAVKLLLDLQKHLRQQRIARGYRVTLLSAQYARNSRYASLFAQHLAHRDAVESMRYVRTSRNQDLSQSCHIF